MRPRIPLVAAVLLLAPAMGARADEAKGSLDEKALDAIVTKAMKDFGAPGVAVGVVKDGKVVYLKGHGVRDQESGEPVTPETLFRAGGEGAR
jgi:CubicO group peptidase (beta-lactamase class C family)